MQAPRVRRSSRVIRQHSYDDEVKGTAKTNTTEETTLGVPAPMPRRASAYDVFSIPPLNAASPLPGSRRSSFKAIQAELANPAVRTASPTSPEIEPNTLTAPDEEVRTSRRGSQLPDIAAIRNAVAAAAAAAAIPNIPPSIPIPIPIPIVPIDIDDSSKRQASIDADAIRIVIHDVDSGSAVSAQKRVFLKKDPTDKSYRTRGFGMRSVGGKSAPGGGLFAYIVWTIPGGPAEKGGLQQGDKILEWGGIPLIDRSFEDVCAIMDRTGDMIELLVEHATELRMCDLLDEPLPPSCVGRKYSDSGISALHIDIDTDQTPSSPTRRKLPRTPEQAVVREPREPPPVPSVTVRERHVSGRVQIQVWYHDERKELVVAVLAADDLTTRDETFGYGTLPEAYAKLCLLPLRSEEHCVQTDVAPASQNPIWNANLSFPGVPGDELMERTLQITLWDLIPQYESSFLGECSVDLQKAFLDDRAIWCRLEDPRQLLGKPPHTSPRSTTGAKRMDFGNQNSASDDIDSIGECASLLHPDHAWGSRRGSSQSEQLEIEVYELGKDFSRSLPGSRRSSFQSIQEQIPEPERPVVLPPATYAREGRRSSCTRILRDPEEILKSLKAVKELGRTLSLTGDKNK